jgi:hypothetical protein
VSDTHHGPVLVVDDHPLNRPARLSPAPRGEAEQAREAGCVDYITKPIDTRGFAALIASLIG